MENTRNRIMLIAIGALFCLMLILAGIYPYHPKSYIGWMVLYLFSLPIVILFEVLGEKAFSSKISNELGSGSRMIYAAIILGLLMFLSALSVSWLEPYFEKWGS